MRLLYKIIAMNSNNVEQGTALVWYPQADSASASVILRTACNRVKSKKICNTSGFEREQFHLNFGAAYAWRAIPYTNIDLGA